MIKKILNLVYRKPIGTHILVACFPKSGSTYLSKSLMEISGFTRAPFVQYYGHNEQDIFRPALERVLRKNTVTQQHVKGTGYNIALLKEFKVRPVILIRNIYDVVLSVYDHIEREDHRFSAVYIHKQYFEMDRDEKIWFLINNTLPWYFSFLVSWKEASAEIDTFWTSYEELFSDQQSVLKRILDFYSLPVDAESVERSISKMKKTETRFNIGVSGRGDTLSDVQKGAILNFARIWKVTPSVMESVGIEL